MISIEGLAGTTTGTGIACYDDQPSHFVWFSAQGGEGNWVSMTFQNAGTETVQGLSVRLAYEGSFECCSLVNAQGKPLLETAPETVPPLAASQSCDLKFRISDLSSSHQHQKFVLELVLAGAMLARSRPIEVRARNPQVGRKRMAEQAQRTSDGARSAGSVGEAPSARRQRQMPAVPAALLASSATSAQPSAQLSMAITRAPAPVGSALARPLGSGATTAGSAAEALSLPGMGEPQMACRDALLTLLTSLPHEQQRQIHSMLGKRIQQSAKLRFRKVVNTIIFMKRAGQRRGLRSRPEDVGGEEGYPNVPENVFDLLNSQQTEEWLTLPESQELLERLLGPETEQDGSGSGGGTHFAAV
jgi:hypothetical protein